MDSDAEEAAAAALTSSDELSDEDSEGGRRTPAGRARPPTRAGSAGVKPKVARRPAAKDGEDDDGAPRSQAVW